MKKSISSIFIVTISLMILVLAGFIATKKATPTFANPVSHYKAHSLLNASQKEIKQAALDYTADHITVLSGNPEVIHTQQINALDLPKYDLDTISYNKLMVITVVKGDFDIKHAMLSTIRNTSPEHFKYLVYGFDAATGKFMLFEASKNGGAFRKILNDPSLPILNTNHVNISNGPTIIPQPTAPIGEGGNVEPPVMTPFR